MNDIDTPIRTKASGQWWVQVRGESYGPYSRDQLATFISEGRVLPTTKVSDAKDGVFIEARKVIGLMGHTRDAANDQGGAANIFVHADISSGASNAFKAAMSAAGSFCDLGPGLWLLRTNLSVGAIRNTLSQSLESGDRLVVVDASRDRLAWFNLGPEVDVKITKVWNTALRPEQR